MIKRPYGPAPSLNPLEAWRVPSGRNRRPQGVRSRRAASGHAASHGPQLHGRDAASEVLGRVEERNTRAGRGLRGGIRDQHDQVAGVNACTRPATQRASPSVARPVAQAAGGWRVKLINGTMWLKVITAVDHWAERTSVLRIMLAALRGRGGLAEFPDFDVVYMHNDNDITPPRPWPGCDSRRHATINCSASSRRLPLLTNSHTRKSPSLPVPEFSWAGWGKHTRPWCETFSELAIVGGAVTFANRTDRAFFSGGLRTGSVRKQVGRIAQSNDSASRSALLVRDVAPAFYTPKKGQRTGAEAKLPLSAACGYKYVLSLAGGACASHRCPAARAARLFAPPPARAACRRGVRSPPS